MLLRIDREIKQSLLNKNESESNIDIRRSFVDHYKQSTSGILEYFLVTPPLLPKHWHEVIFVAHVETNSTVDQYKHIDPPYLA